MFVAQQVIAGKNNIFNQGFYNNNNNRINEIGLTKR